MKLYIKNINYNLGNIKLVDSLIKTTDRLNYLKSIGLMHYCESECNEFELAYTSIKETLNNHDKPQIILYSSDSLDNHENQKDEFSKIMCDLEISDVYPIGQFLTRCSNLSSSIITAMNLLKTDLNIESILVALSDKINANENRLSPLNYIASDAASSLIISREKTPESFEIIDVFEYANHAMVNHNPEEQLIQYLKLVEESLEKVCRGHFDKIDYQPEDFYKFICGNYNLTIMKNYARICGFDEAQLYTEVLSKYAHTFSSSHLICMRELMPKLKNNSKLFLLTTGDIFFGTLSLKFCK